MQRVTTVPKHFSIVNGIHRRIIEMKLSDNQKSQIATITYQLSTKSIWRSRPPHDHEDAVQQVIATILERIEHPRFEVLNLENYVRRSVKLELRSCLKKLDRERNRLQLNPIWPSGSEPDPLKLNVQRWEPDWNEEERRTLLSAIDLLPETLRASVNRFLDGQGKGKGREHHRFCRAVQTLRSIVETRDLP